VTSKKASPPPKTAEWILSRIYPDKGEFTSVGDFREEYEEVYQSEGPFRAHLWYWRQIIKSIPSLIQNKIHWSLIMIHNYLKVAFRNIKRHKGYSFINITSLALGIACCSLISGLIIYELSYDNFHENSANIYRVNRDVFEQGRQYYVSMTPYQLMQGLLDEYPEIIHATREKTIGASLVGNKKTSFYVRTIKIVDNAFFQMFSFPFIKGDKNTALMEPYSVVITKEMAEKFFPGEDPVGKLLTMNNEHDFLVTGIIENIPPNSIFQFDMAVSFKPPFDYPRPDNWASVSLTTYVQLNPEASVDDFTRKIRDFIQVRMDKNIEKQVRLFLEPFDDIRLSQYVDSPRQTLYIYSLCAFVILLIACINFINLSTARSSGRAKEIGIRKVVGAFRINVASQFLGESLLISFISLFAALALAGLLLPIFTHLVNMDTAGFTYLSLMKPGVILVIIGVTVFTGFAAGSYPALMLSGYKPVKILKGHLNRESRGFVFRKILVVAQFSFSIILIVGTLVIFNQLNFLKTQEVGYNKEQIVTIHLREGSEKFYPQFKNQLLMDSKIQGVSGMEAQLPFFGWRTPDSHWEGKDPDNHGDICFNHIDYDFLETLDIELVEGRYFSRDFPTDAHSFIVNETLANLMGTTSVIGKRLMINEQTGSVIGIMKDFIFNRPDLEEVQPLAFMLGPDKVSFVIIKIQEGEMASTLDFIDKIWKQTVHMFPFTYSFLDSDFYQSFRATERLGKLSTTSTSISILIACLGLLGLAAYTAQQRTKEIGVRKVLGASASKIVLMLSLEFIKWVIIANVIAWPVAYFMMSRWLQNFAYRTSIGLWIFILSALLSIALAVLTVSFQAFKAGTANPVDSLRYE
jgi:putative ABC transport system permease protein